MQALPVFLAGCRTLLVLPGTTYCLRLWCVMELFVFVKMGGTREQIEVRALGGEDVNRSLLLFDAVKAQCFVPADRHRLLAVVESGFGDFEPFNKLVRSLFSGESAGDLAPSASAVGKAKAARMDQVGPHRLRTHSQENLIEEETPPSSP